MKATIRLTNSNIVYILDQTKLPFKEQYIIAKGSKRIIDAIEKLSIRGAPAIGVAGGFASYLALKESKNSNLEKIFQIISSKLDLIESARPTAVNLSWSVNRFRNILKLNRSKKIDFRHLLSLFRKEALKIYEEEKKVSLKLSSLGSKLIKNNDKIITHCNTGSLATTGPGTALGAIKFANKIRKGLRVFATETRPLLQGSRLTIWECQKNNIDCTLISDSMVSHIIKEEKINMIVVGADRIASNGDTANKIGTYQLAIAAKFHKIPFFVVAPISTFDFSCRNGLLIEIEERDGKELLSINNKIVSKANNVRNPAFDVTPRKLITGIITEKGIIYSPNANKIKRFKNRYS
ncbi:MAG TPA: S-methyl-5-thioribose-1-phosphate isomerase [Candidatus Dadabacteria bacterium]|mgnify:CR=1 FL=1|nr:S-methyl-5-thioribose-1-phosphate isomerase [Candidatus Dadabacteria bacterium]